MKQTRSDVQQPRSGTRKHPTAVGLPPTGEEPSAPHSYIPGTVLPLTAENEHAPFSALDPVFALSGGGLSLSQLSEMTGLKPTTIQNWVKRGWVANPVGKKYGRRQVARVLLINLMRPAMQLEHIAHLLGGINGAVEDESDDTVEESVLFNLLCCAVILMERRSAISPACCEEIAAQVMARDGAALPDAVRRRVSDVLLLMLYNMAAAQFMHRAALLYTKIGECI